MPWKWEKKQTVAFTYNNFDKISYYQIFLYGEAADIGGGTITKEEIDVIREHPEWKRIAIAGLHQDTFEYFVETYGAQFEAICFHKNKMVSDLSILGTLDRVEVLAYFLNQRAEKLWDMRGNHHLRMLSLNDFSRLHDLTGIETAPQLQYLDFGNMVWATSEVHILPDLSHSKLQKIGFNAAVSCENVYHSFLQIPELQQLDFRTNMYKTEFLAWICANYPQLKGNSLQPYVHWDEKSGTICGKRKASFDDINSEKDSKRVANACKRFETMKRKFQGMSFEEIRKIL